MFKQRLNKAAYVVLACFILWPSLVVAAPTGGVVTNGDASINQSGTVTDINQASQKAAINWQGFSVATNETVNFNQSNASAMTLNRVIGNERSVIEGAINANGKVYLINSNGVLFTGTSKVNVGGLVASTLNITDDDFMNGNFVFQSNQDNPASIINQGDIIAADGGDVYKLIHNMDGFSLINTVPDGYYALAQDITRAILYDDNVGTSTFIGPSLVWEGDIYEFEDAEQ